MARHGGAGVNVLITGGAGFLGALLARQLLSASSLSVAGAEPRRAHGVTLLRLAPADWPRTSAGVIRGDLGDLPGTAGAGREALAGADVIFHLAAAVSGECEADFDLGVRANLRATESLLASCRELRTNPVVVFASSVAVFGASPEHPLPAVVDDHTMPNPQSSYGVQKVIGEQLLADFTRKGFLRGRAIRLMTISVRPRPNAAASGFCPDIRAARRRPCGLPGRRGPRWRSPRQAGPSAACCAPPPRPISPGAGGLRSTCQRSP